MFKNLDGYSESTNKKGSSKDVFLACWIKINERGFIFNALCLFVYTLQKYLDTTKDVFNQKNPLCNE